MIICFPGHDRRDVEEYAMDWSFRSHWRCGPSKWAFRTQRTHVYLFVASRLSLSFSIHTTLYSCSPANFMFLRLKTLLLPGGMRFVFSKPAILPGSSSLHKNALLIFLHRCRSYWLFSLYVASSQAGWIHLHINSASTRQMRWIPWPPAGNSCQILSGYPHSSRRA